MWYQKMYDSTVLPKNIKIYLSIIVLPLIYISVSINIVDLYLHLNLSNSHIKRQTANTNILPNSITKRQLYHCLWSWNKPTIIH